MWKHDLAFARLEFDLEFVAPVPEAHADALECRLEASVEGQLEALKGAVSSHLDRFAFREAPFAFDWRDA